MTDQDTTNKEPTVTEMPVKDEPDLGAFDMILAEADEEIMREEAENIKRRLKGQKLRVSQCRRVLRNEERELELMTAELREEYGE